MLLGLLVHMPCAGRMKVFLVSGPHANVGEEGFNQEKSQVLFRLGLCCNRPHCMAQKPAEENLHSISVSRMSSGRMMVHQVAIDIIAIEDDLACRKRQTLPL